MCLNNGVSNGAGLDQNGLIQCSLTKESDMSEKDDLAWIELDMASLPDNVRKHIEEGFHHRKLSKDAFDQARKALEKRWTETKRMLSSEEILLAPDRFGKKIVKVAKKPRTVSKASNKPVVGW
jgi:hypothetical protein